MCIDSRERARAPARLLVAVERVVVDHTQSPAPTAFSLVVSLSERVADLHRARTETPLGSLVVRFTRERHVTALRLAVVRTQVTVGRRASDARRRRTLAVVPSCTCRRRAAVAQTSHTRSERRVRVLRRSLVRVAGVGRRAFGWRRVSASVVRVGAVRVVTILGCVDRRRHVRQLRLALGAVPSECASPEGSRTDTRCAGSDFAHARLLAVSVPGAFVKVVAVVADTKAGPSSVVHRFGVQSRTVASRRPEDVVGVALVAATACGTEA